MDVGIIIDQKNPAHRLPRASFRFNCL